MSRHSTPPEESWESDAVWKLLDQAPPANASSRFVDDTVRAARLAVREPSWWRRLLFPGPLAGLTAATAALAFSAVALFGPHETKALNSEVTLVNSPQAADIQEIAETETLIAAVDHLEDFSDTELVSMIGF